MTLEKKLVVTIGAGVIGLQTSISLLQAGYQVVIIGKHLPGETSIEYTSPWAGGHWRSDVAQSSIEQQQWDTETYRYWLDVIESENKGTEGVPWSGLALRKSRIYSATQDQPWYSNIVNSYEPVPEALLPPGIQSGHTFTSIMINVPVYLDWLQAMAQSLGAIIIKNALPSGGKLSETLQDATNIVTAYLTGSGHGQVIGISAFVNATGISARNLVPDPDVYPIRGQTVTVAGEASQITSIDAYASEHSASGTPIVYVLPRPHSNTTILGGTHEVGSWAAEPDQDTTNEIVQRTKEWAPELLNQHGEFEVLSAQVGLRPGRTGGPRVGMESLDGYVICHAYGHAGGGYQKSIGTANKVVKLLESWFER